MDRGDPEIQLLGAYEFTAAAYGWTPQEVREQLTDELLVAYLDAAQDRLDADYRRDVEVGRLATIFGSPYGGKPYDAWRRSQGVALPPRGLTGAALESAISHLRGHVPVVNETISAAELGRRRAEVAAIPRVRHERAVN